MDEVNAVVVRMLMLGHFTLMGSEEKLSEEGGVMLFDTSSAATKFKKMKVQQGADSPPGLI